MEYTNYKKQTGGNSVDRSDAFVTIPFKSAFRNEFQTVLKYKNKCMQKHEHNKKVDVLLITQDKQYCNIHNKTSTFCHFLGTH